MFKNLVMFTDSFEFIFKFLQFKKNKLDLPHKVSQVLQQCEIPHKEEPGTL
jgi:hypothetical protein